MRAADVQKDLWDRAQTEVRGRLARIERGETSAPDRVVRCLRVFVGLPAVRKSAPRSRPCWPITRSSGDVDKLQRAIFDALTDAGVWRDDSQVVDVHASKLHVGDLGALRIPGALVTVVEVAS